MALPTLTTSAESDQLTLPTQDSWYTAPPDLERAAPGTVLKIRTVPGGPGVFNNASVAYHILYRTTDSHYKPTWAVTLVIYVFSPLFSPFLSLPSTPSISLPLTLY